MRFISIILVAISVAGCAKKSEFPAEFVGAWEFEVSSVYKEIDEKNLPEEEAKALKYAFGDIEKNQECTVTKNGVFRFPQLPPDVHIQLTVLSKTDKGYVFREVNSTNPTVAEFSLNLIQNGIWKSVLISEDLKPVHPNFPNTYWIRKPNQRPERNAGATSPSNSESTPGVAHP